MVQLVFTWVNGLYIMYSDVKRPNIKTWSMLNTNISQNLEEGEITYKSWLPDYVIPQQKL